MRLADFAGRWALSRRIEDRLAGRTGTLEGSARFVPQNGGLAYSEEGVLRFPDQPELTARQSYFWQEDAEGIAVYFADGRAFHRIDLAVPEPAARHDCAPDTYDVSYDFRAWPDWTATWTVTGPRKDYVSVSRYRPRK